MVFYCLFSLCLPKYPLSHSFSVSLHTFTQLGNLPLSLLADSCKPHLPSDIQSPSLISSTAISSPAHSNAISSPRCQYKLTPRTDLPSRGLTGGLSLRLPLDQYQPAVSTNRAQVQSKDPDALRSCYSSLLKPQLAYKVIPMCRDRGPPWLNCSM